MVYKTTISELGDDEVYSSLQRRLDEIRDIPRKVSEEFQNLNQIHVVG